MANLVLGPYAAGPVDDRSVPRATPVGCDLLRPLVRGAHGVGPTHGVVVEGLGSAEEVDALDHELGGLQLGHSIEGEYLVESALDLAFGRSAVVADHVEDESVFESPQVIDGIDETTSCAASARAVR